MILNSRRHFFEIEFRTLMTEVKIQEIYYLESLNVLLVYLYF